MSTPSVTATSSRRGLMRWSIAAAATAAFVVSGSGLVVFAQSGAGESQGPQFAPADAVAYVEARLDMPGGQAESVAQMMTAFPGFADTGSFDMKVDELFAMLSAQLGAGASEGDLIGDVFTGEIGIALSNIESAMMGEDPAIVAGLAMADAEAAGAMVDQLMAGASPDSVTESSYNDVAIYSDPTATTPLSVAMHGDWMLIGMGEGTIEGAIDVLDGAATGLLENEAFSAAWARLPDARLAGAWMDLAQLAGILDFAAAMAEGETGVALPTADIAAMLPVDMTASLVAEDDGMTFEAFVTPGASTPTMPVGESELAMVFPADTQVYLEMRDLGSMIESGMAQLETLMESQMMAAGEGALGDMSDIEMLFSEDSPITDMLGAPLREILDFVGDAAVGTAYGEGGLWLGIAGEIVDADAADERVGNIMTVLRMFTLQMADEGVLIEEEMVGDTEVTTITLPPLESMMAESGLPSVGDTISVAIHDDTLLIGLGDFVQAAITSDGSDSLAVSEGYVDALGDDVVNSGLLYADIGSMMSTLDPVLASMSPEWSQVAPYAAGLDRMVAVGTDEDGAMRSRMSIIVGQ